jgi:hypothetical protein
LYFNFKKIAFFESLSIKNRKKTIESLNFWKNYQHKFSFLSRNARPIVCIPVKTTNVKREFSNFGWILNQRWTIFQPDKWENILWVWSTQRILYKNKLRVFCWLFSYS